MDRIQAERSSSFEKYRLSHLYCAGFHLDGTPHLFAVSKGRHSCRISESTRLLLGCFEGGRALSVAEVIPLYARRAGKLLDEALRSQINSTVETLRTQAVLITEDSATSSYTEPMCRDYEASRAVPERVAQFIIGTANIGRSTRVLDCATGTGSLAIHLSTASQKVIGLDTSSDFIRAAKASALRQHYHTEFSLFCANQLAYFPGKFDVVTLSQALHWLDPWNFGAGLDRIMSGGSHLFIVDTAPILSAAHPLHHLYEYGFKDRSSAMRHLTDLRERYALFFRAVGWPKNSLRFYQDAVLREDKLFDESFSRALFTPSHITNPEGAIASKWTTLIDRLRNSRTFELEGSLLWGIYHFVKHAS